MAVQRQIRSVTKEQFNLAGWLSIARAALTIPALILSFVLGFIQGVTGRVIVIGVGTKIILAALGIIGLGIYIYIYSSLRQLLNNRFSFHDIDTYITAFIWVGVVGFVFNILASISEQLGIVVIVISFFAIIPLGIISIVFAAKLLRLPDDLFGLLKPFSYTIIASGVCYTSIILIPLGIIAEAVAGVILGMIFFRAAAEKSQPNLFGPF